MSTHMNFAIDEQNGPKMQKWQITMLSATRGNPANRAVNHQTDESARTAIFPMDLS
jgi:hypothetical protein